MRYFWHVENIISYGDSTILFGGFFPKRGVPPKSAKNIFHKGWPPLGGRPGERSFYKDVKDGFAETE